MVAGEILNPFPKEWPRAICIGRMGERFAVKTSIFAVDLQCHDPDQIPIGSGNELEFGEMLFDIEHLKPSTFPKQLQTWKVIDIGSTDDALRRIHGAGPYVRDFGG